MGLKRISQSIITSAVLLLGLSTGAAWAIVLDDHPKVKAVADRLIAEGHYNRAELDAIFAGAEVQQSVLDAMMNPAEYKFTWGKYRKLFLKEDRIQQGVAFWQENQAVLERAEKQYGVPASMIVAIIGVESKFGKFKGKYKVLDSLVSLVTGFPRRSKFFAGELEEFLILTKENKLQPNEILGSYAGAVGYPQFISSSYRNYAIDFNADGRTDLIGQVDDAIGSIANYFIENGWKPGRPVTSAPTDTVADAVQKLASRKRKVQYTAASLRAKGASIANGIEDTEKLGVLMLDASEVVHDKAETGTYIVRAGDTACQIAERFKVSCKSLFKINKLNANGVIFRGQRLKLPAKAKKQSQVSTAAKAANSGKKVAPQKKLVKSQGGKWEVAKLESAESVSSPNGARSNESKSKEIEKAAEPEKSQESGPQPIYFYTHHNFYAITQYNHSVLYAMAVYDLSTAIDAQYVRAQTVSQHSK